MSEIVASGMPEESGPRRPNPIEIENNYMNAGFPPYLAMLHDELYVRYEATDGDQVHTVRQNAGEDAASPEYVRPDLTSASKRKIAQELGGATQQHNQPSVPSVQRSIAFDVAEVVDLKALGLEEADDLPEDF